jgi:hypothetical protein
MDWKGDRPVQFRRAIQSMFSIINALMRNDLFICIPQKNLFHGQSGLLIHCKKRGDLKRIVQQNVQVVVDPGPENFIILLSAFFLSQVRWLTQT